MTKMMPMTCLTTFVVVVVMAEVCLSFGRILSHRSAWQLPFSSSWPWKNECFGLQSGSDASE